MSTARGSLWDDLIPEPERFLNANLIEQQEGHSSQSEHYCSDYVAMAPKVTKEIC